MLGEGGRGALARGQSPWAPERGVGRRSFWTSMRRVGPSLGRCPSLLMDHVGFHNAQCCFQGSPWLARHPVQGRGVQDVLSPALQAPAGSASRDQGRGLLLQVLQDIRVPLTLEQARRGARSKVLAGGHRTGVRQGIRGSRAWGECACARLGDARARQEIGPRRRSVLSGRKGPRSLSHSTGLKIQEIPALKEIPSVFNP